MGDALRVMPSICQNGNESVCIYGVVGHGVKTMGDDSLSTPIFPFIVRVPSLSSFPQAISKYSLHCTPPHIPILPEIIMSEFEMILMGELFSIKKLIFLEET